MNEIEIRVRPVVRFLVTRYEKIGPENDRTIGSQTMGEFPNSKQANRVACALHGYEHECMTVDSEGKPSAEVKLTLADD